MSKFIRRLTPGEALPKWYGVAYSIDRWTHRSPDVLAAPIGFNLLVFMAVSLYHFVRTLPYDVPMNPRAAFAAGLQASEAYEQGERSGYQRGREDGLRCGYSQGREDSPGYAEAYREGAADATRAFKTTSDLMQWHNSRELDKPQVINLTAQA
jgi:hypothetical protein